MTPPIPCLERYTGPIEPTLLSPESFRAALAKGLGRTLLTLKKEDAAPYRAAILDACLTCEPHRFWFEPSPAPYLMEHVRAAEMENLVLNAALDAYTPESPDHIRWHLALLLGEYAKMGVTRAFERLSESARQGDRAARGALEFYPQGITWLAENILPGLPIQERRDLKDWLDEVPEDDASETMQTLREAEAEYRAFCDGRLADTPQKPPLDPSAFLAVPPEKRKRLNGWTFAYQADDAQLAVAAREFTEAKSEDALDVFFRIFTKRPFPLDPALLVVRADEDGRGWAFRAAMSQVDSPLVREYALRLLDERPLPYHAIWALESSFKPGDEPKLLHALESIEREPDEPLHHHVKCLTDLIEKQSLIELEPFERWIYEKSPCATCRARHVRWMMEDDALPEDMGDELLFDVDRELREEVRAYLAKKPQNGPEE